MQKMGVSLLVVMQKEEEDTAGRWRTTDEADEFLRGNTAASLNKVAL